MEADSLSFLDKLTSCTRDELLTLARRQYERICELEIRENENARINTESHLEYQRICSERDQLREENLSLKNALQKEIEKNELLNRSVFGRHTEKFLDTIQGTSGEVFEDEKQSEDGKEEVHARVVDPAVFQEALSRNVEKNASNKDSGKPEGSEKTEKKRAGCGKKAGKKDALRESVDRLPQQLEYNINVEELDRKYGKGNWRIAFWQETKTLEKLPVVYYQKTVYTPSISIGLEHRLETQPMPERLMPWSLVSPSMAADVLTRKFFLSIPTGRQEKDYKRQELMLSKQDMIHWINTLVPSVLNTAYEYLTVCLLRRKYVQNDETYFLVNRDGRSPGSRSFMWVHCSCELDGGPPIIIFCYEKTRGTDHLRKFFREFMGYCTCDAYISYQVMEKEHPDTFRVTGCLMHLRRYFAISFFVQKLDAMADEEILELPETKVLLKIRRIYQEENRLKELSAEDRLAARKRNIAPMVDGLFSYIHELENSGEVVSERLHDAIRYSVNQEQRIRMFLTDGTIPIDNGHVERVISSYSVGRANWKFADTIHGAEVTAVMYSLTETARANGADVELYLRYLFERIPKHLKADGTIDDREFLPELTPWSAVYRSYEQMQKQRGLILCRQMFPVPERPSTPRKERATA